MITCRTVLRTERLSRLVDTVSSSTRLRSIQFPSFPVVEGYSFHSSTRLRNQSVDDKLSPMDWKNKGKSVNPEWRSVTNVSNMNAEASSDLPDDDKRKAAERAHCSVARHSISIEVGTSLMRFIKGNSGSTLKIIEETMGVKIIFPSHKNADSIVIEGDSEQSITKASDKIQSLVSEIVQSPNIDYSHFISLPLALHPELVEKLVRFQNSILGNNSSQADMNEKAHVGSDEHASEDLEIDKSIFIKPKTFHLTVLMLKLWNRERVHAAKNVLQSISPKVMDALDGRPISVRLKGLDCMQGSMSKARVVYAPVEEVGEENRLLQACQVIIDAFTEAGLVFEKDARRKLKLHATLMNAKHGRRKMGKKRMDWFDARGIFDKYGSEEWGEYEIGEAHLSQRFVFDNSGYYHCCGSLPFPTTAVME